MDNKMSDRFWTKVNIGPPDECWLWNAGLTSRGYGTFSTGTSKSSLAHRYSFFLANGFYPPVVMHSCDTPRCVNPQHLKAGTQALNVADCVAKGRTHGLIRGTHCHRGHEYTPENTYLRSRDNSRECRTCQKLANEKNKNKKRASKELSSTQKEDNV